MKKYLEIEFLSLFALVAAILATIPTVASPTQDLICSADKLKLSVTFRKDRRSVYTVLINDNGRISAAPCRPVDIPHPNQGRTILDCINIHPRMSIFLHEFEDLRAGHYYSASADSLSTHSVSMTCPDDAWK